LARDSVFAGHPEFKSKMSRRHSNRITRSLPITRTVHYCFPNNKHFTFPANALPEQLHGQKQIVDLMANYMEQNLMEVWESWLLSVKTEAIIYCLI